MIPNIFRDEKYEVFSSKSKYPVLPSILRFVNKLRSPIDIGKKVYCMSMIIQDMDMVTF